MRPHEITRTFRSMATDVTMRVVAPKPDAIAALDKAEELIRRVAASCTRFDPTSALMRANAAPRRWHEVPVELYDALSEAHDAYVSTDGLFDPRVLQSLEAWGYDTSLPFRSGPVTTTSTAATGVRAGRAPAVPGKRRWRPKFDLAKRAVRIGALPVDLGGIGKGLAVRWAADVLSGTGKAVLVEAGGDLNAEGAGPEGEGWLVGVEDPRGSETPMAVLRLTDRACATSSVRLRTWTVDGRKVNHIVDPRTGDPAETGLLSVTVVGPDVARAEVWSKSLFLAGRGRVRQLADDHGIAALLIDTDGVIGLSAAMRPLVTWQADRGW